MKQLTTIRPWMSLIIILAIQGLPASLGAAEGDVPPSPPSEEKDPLHNEALQAYGWLVGFQGGLAWDFTEAEKEQILIGIKRVANGHPAPANMEALMPKVDEIVGAKAKQFQEDQANKAKETARDYLAAAVKTEGIEKTESGLVYRIVEEGIGKYPEPDDIVRVNYQGRLINGQVFDSSSDRGGPVDFSIPNLIPGFREGVRLIREAGKIVLYVPPELGYGEKGTKNIPPNSVLIFEVELIEVNPVGARVKNP